MGSLYRELKVWQLAMELVAEAYAQTRAFPKDEMYGLTSQMSDPLFQVAEKRKNQEPDHSLSLLS